MLLVFTGENNLAIIPPSGPLQFEVIETRTNNMFELATQEEVDKLGTSGAGGGYVQI